MPDMKVTGYPNLVRSAGAAILNTNSDEYTKALLRINKAKKDKQNEARLNALESKMDRILDMLGAFLNVK